MGQDETELPHVEPEGDAPALKRPASAKGAKLPLKPKAEAKGKPAPTPGAKAKGKAKPKQTVKEQAAKASGPKLCKPSFYKNSNRWAIKKGGKEMISAPWLHPVSPCSCLLWSGC